MRKIGIILIWLMVASIAFVAWQSKFGRHCVEQYDCEPYASQGSKYTGGGSVKMLCKCARWE